MASEPPGSQRGKGGMGMSFMVGGPPQVELPPLRLLLAGDFSGAGQGRSRGPLPLDKETLREVLASFGRELVLEVPNLLAPGSVPNTRFVRLQVSELKDFTPEAVLAADPLLAQARQAVACLQQVAAGKRPPSDLQGACQGLAGLGALAEPFRLALESLESGEATGQKQTAAAPAPGPAASAHGSTAEGGQDAASRILEMVDTSASAAGAGSVDAAAAVSRLISGVVGSGRKRSAGSPASPGLSGAVVQARRVLGEQVAALLHHRELQQVEAAWRGLKFLVDRSDFRSGLRLEVLDVVRDDMLRVLREQVAEPELAGQSDQPLSLMVICCELGNGSSDMELLQGLAEVADELQVPLLASVEPSFFGLGSGAEMGSLPFVGSLMNEPQYIKWNALREKECSRWLAVACNRFLLRPPYGQKDPGAADLDEKTDAPEHFLWGSPVWAVTSLVTRSFAEVGWPTEITGTEHGCVPDLPIRELSERGRPLQIPLEGFVGQDRARDLADAGLVPLSSAPTGDAAYVFFAPVVHRPARSSDQAQTVSLRKMSSLSFQMLASRVADLLSRNKARLTSGSSPVEIQRALEAFLAGVVTGTGPGAFCEVKLQPNPDRPSGLVAHLVLRTGRQILGGVELRLAIGV